MAGQHQVDVIAVEQGLQHGAQFLAAAAPGGGIEGVVQEDDRPARRVVGQLPLQPGHLIPRGLGVFVDHVGVERDDANALIIDPIHGLGQHVGRAVLGQGELQPPLGRQHLRGRALGLHVFVVARRHQRRGLGQTVGVHIEPFAPFRVVVGPVDQVAGEQHEGRVRGLAQGAAHGQAAHGADVVLDVAHIEEGEGTNLGGGGLDLAPGRPGAFLAHAIDVLGVGGQAGQPHAVIVGGDVLFVPRREGGGGALRRQADGFGRVGRPRRQNRIFDEAVARTRFGAPVEGQAGRRRLGQIDDDAFGQGSRLGLRRDGLEGGEGQDAAGQGRGEAQGQAHEVSSMSGKGAARGRSPASGRNGQSRQFRFRLR